MTRASRLRRDAVAGWCTSTDEAEASGLDEPMSEPAGRTRVDLMVFAIRAAGSLGVILAATSLPWATITQGVPAATTGFDAGSLAAALIGLGLVAIALSLALLARPLGLLRWAVLAECAVTLGFAVVLALRSIAAANATPAHAYSQTAYAIGSLVGVLSAGAMLAVSVVDVARSSS